MSSDRIQKRRHLVYYLAVYDRETSQPLGRVIDITTKGLKLCAEQPVETDRTYQLTMRLPGHAGTNEHVEFEARIIWCRPDINPDLYAVGLSLVGDDDERQQAIMRLIRDYAFPDTSSTKLR